MDSPKRINKTSLIFESAPGSMFSIDEFKYHVNKTRSAKNKYEKAECISRLLQTTGFIKHYESKRTNCLVLALCEKFECEHELQTCIKLADEQYNVLLVPHGYFGLQEKKFDVFLCREHIMLESDLKRITSKNPDTIAARIKSGSEQSSRLVVDVVSNIEKMVLIDGLKSGCERNKLIEEIMLFYKSRFYRMKKSQILSKSIYDLIK